MSEGFKLFIFGCFTGSIATILLEFIYCALVVGGEDDE